MLTMSATHRSSSMSKLVKDNLQSFLYICFGFNYQDSLVLLALAFAIKSICWNIFDLSSDTFQEHLVKHLINSFLAFSAQYYSTMFTNQCFVLGSNVLRCSKETIEEKPKPELKIDLRKVNSLNLCADLKL